MLPFHSLHISTRGRSTLSCEVIKTSSLSYRFHARRFDSRQASGLGSPPLMDEENDVQRQNP